MKLAGSILVVDDDRNNRLLCSEILSSAGYQVKTAPTAMDALEVMRESSFDIVVSDINMPRLDGFKFYDTAVGLYPHLKDSFLFMTAGMAENVRTFLCRGGQPCIAKPYRVTDLLGEVDRLMVKSFERPSKGIPRRRGEDRFELNGECGVIVEDESRQKLIEAEGEDASNSGLKIVHEGAPLAEGSAVTLILSIRSLNLRRDATVAWSKRISDTESLAGLSIKEPLPGSSLIKALESDNASPDYEKSLIAVRQAGF